MRPKTKKPEGIPGLNECIMFPISISSLAIIGGKAPLDPKLCVPAFRQVCLFAENYKFMTKLYQNYPLENLH
jgi:hypothetical protein